MPGDVLIGTVAEIPAGEGRTFAVSGRMITVFHTRQGEVFATQPHCPHLGGPLADGLLGGATVVCPLHDRVFDLRTGCGLSHEKPAIATYPVKLASDGAIWIDPQAMAAAAE